MPARIEAGDEYSNNKRPYRWIVSNGPGSFFGQEVTHWLPIPEKPDSY